MLTVPDNDADFWKFKVTYISTTKYVTPEAAASNIGKLLDSYNAATIKKVAF